MQQLNPTNPNRKLIINWLCICLMLVALMVVVGGLTRLTESGLSMVEWKPTTILPPINEAEWQEEFSKYQQSPEYQKVNKGFGVEGFKQIFWLEYLHRLLGRLIGITFLIPLLYFVFRKQITGAYALRLGGIFLLGGLQGLIGWLMVKSGLQDQPWVSPVRLMLHLGMAFILFGLIWWEILKLKCHAELVSASTATQTLPNLIHGGSRNKFGMTLIAISLTLLFLQILLGALVAGLDAGLLYNTFPTMAGEWVPTGIWLLEPWYLNLAENGTTVHFLHRLGALITTTLIVAMLFTTYKQSPVLKQNAAFILIALIVQIVLGVLTVIHAVPIAIASLHQAAALLLYTFIIRHLYLTK